ncbi:5-oxoprolinase/urea amidolyase family protein [Microbacterium fluvii]|uniref:5-oxoprolinase/urea amidolyase family protein n=1 Tax=Microbacterium fluvii TaxID=415215 RepID=A0ABW2HBP8_9MICO|nr:5-oxoprolinase/urea amidolyase family protein [Microbacterium fluvii]
MILHPMGESALLVEVDALEAVLRLRAQLAASAPEGVVDLVPAARTVLVRVDPHVLALPAARAWVQRAAAADAVARASAETDEVELPVVYDGADLAETAALLGVSVEALVRAHLAAAWTVAFTGFAPGFGYLVSDDWPFDVPRLDSPRTRVPAGAVGLAGRFSGAYPRETPGGWRLIGTTGAALFDPRAASPALLRPGARVRFAVARAPASVAAAAAPVPAEPAVPSARRQLPDETAVSTGGLGSRMQSRGEAGAAPADADAHGPAAFEVVEPGLLATVQDLGRAGAASLGVARSGALDRGALRTANRLVGNPEAAAAVEVTMGGLRAVARRDLWVAVAGAWGPIVLDGREVDPYLAHPWPAGTALHLDWFGHGARAYLAVRGGVAADQVLASRATDLLAGLGPAPLRAGDVLAVASEATAPIPPFDITPWGAPHDDEVELDLLPGPRADWFSPEAHRRLFEEVWTVTNDADRVGVRLDGPVLDRIRQGELPSEGMVPGAFQVPPTGRPTVLLADGPVTGGYPVIAVATEAALDLLAQARPGTRIRFRHARP